MSVDAFADNTNYAVFLPAIQEGFARYVISEGRDAPSGYSPADLNFLDDNNRFWKYRSCLASAGAFVNSDKPNAITMRNPSSSWVLGDSGGFQIGTGKLKEIKEWGARFENEEEIKQLWAESQFINDMLRWVECNCDYAMTLDMPLWIRQNKYKKTPFYRLSDQELLEITIKNLKHIQVRRGSFGSCKLLNVIQGLDDETEDNWYREVRKFRFEGWALGGSEGWKGGLTRVLRRLLIMRDDGELEPGQDLLHVLGVSQANWSVALTEIQRGIQRTANPKFSITYDASTPFLNSEQFKKYFRPFEFSTDLTSWSRNIADFPRSQAKVRDILDDPFCQGSPLSSALRIRDVCKEFTLFGYNALNEFGRYALGNHNVFVLIDGFNKACKTANDDGVAPAAVLDMIDIIQRAFEAEEWAEIIEDKRQFLEYVSDYSLWRSERAKK